MSLGLNRRKLSQRGENRTARDLNGRVQPASGATPFAKGDVKLPEFLVERKDTTASQYALKLSELDKIRSQAIQERRMPLFVVGFPTCDYVVMPVGLFVDMTGARL